MITTDYVRLLARYNAWQNRSLYREAEKLTDDQRRADRGAFFGSIHNTLGHLLWGDRMWMSRFDGWEKPTGDPARAEDWIGWTDLAAQRLVADARISAWATRVTEADLAGDLTWYSGLAGAEITKPRALTIVHFFNHQTHHRGQVHALLTGCGMTPDATDLGFMPDDA